MKRLVLAGLFALPAMGVAQTPTPVPPVVAPPTCYPGGIRGQAVFNADWFKSTDNGTFIFWFCKQPDGTYTTNYRHCRTGTCLQGDWLQTEINVSKAIDKGAVLDAVPYTSRKCEDEIKDATPNTALCTEVLAAIAVERAKLPTPVPIPAPAPTPSPTPAPPPPASGDFTVKGISEGQRLSGPIIVEAVPPAAIQGFSFTFVSAGGAVPYTRNKTSAPYCLVGDGPCASFDTKTLADGAYTLRISMTYNSGAQVATELHVTVANAGAPPAPTPAPPPPAPTPAPVPVPPPVTLKYVVARSFLADGSRAVYPVVNGKVGDTPVTGVKALPGEPCDPVTTLVRLGLTYRSVKGRSDWVAVCIPAP